MERWVGRVALVTGASVGIGAAVVRALVKHGMTVIGCARNVQQVQNIADELKSEKGSLLAIKCDVTKEDEILAMFCKIKSEFGGVDVCINNAGLAHDAPLLSGKTDDWRDMLNTNVLAPTICSREAYKQMVEKGVNDGHIILINSMSGHRVYFSSAGHFYNLSKFSVTGLTEGLRNELRLAKSHIRVSAVSPGFVETEFSGRMYKNEAKGKERYRKFQCLQADEIADSVIYILGAPAHVQVHDILMRPTEQMSF